MAVLQHELTLSEAADLLSRALRGDSPGEAHCDTAAGRLACAVVDELGRAFDRAGLPVHLVADRKHDEVLLHRDPVNGKYPAPECYRRGQSVPIPESVGVRLELSVDTLPDGD
ncbi:hypothetical protein ACIOTI_26250 [Streptomyces sp. NPDC087843]|uniref:hypothetical protein n=1 Tax=Streptomyces sp. NPDC087843 TaxID=3365804 RepID=UPI0037FAA908